MNKFNKMEAEGERGLILHKKRKWKEACLYAVIALLLLLAVWIAFFKQNGNREAIKSSTEVKLIELLEGIRGVGEADVMICETEDGAKSVVVVCDGASNFNVMLSVREAVATALNLDQKSVKIYLKKD